MCASTTSVIASGSPSPLSPYHAMFVPMPPSMRLKVATSWADMLVMQARVAARAPHAPLVRKRGFRTSLDGTLRVGFLSRRFERYPGTQLMLRLFRLMDRTRFEVFCYAAGPDDASIERATVASDCDVWKDVSLSSASETAALVRVVASSDHCMHRCRSHAAFRSHATVCTFCSTMMVFTCSTRSLRWLCGRPQFKYRISASLGPPEPTTRWTTCVHVLMVRRGACS